MCELEGSGHVSTTRHEQECLTGEEFGGGRVLRASVSAGSVANLPLSSEPGLLIPETPHEEIKAQSSNPASRRESWDSYRAQTDLTPGCTSSKL